MKNQRVHFIAIGGAAMHNLAIALKIKDYDVTGSDDEIFDPSRSRLDKYGLLPKAIGWDVDNIDEDIDAVILGMHARKDNPELLKAKELGLKIYSYPEYIYEQSKEKNRVVIGGSHGKTSITAMILHVLQGLGVDSDYMVGAQLPEFECMVKLTNHAKYIVLEGDEYLSSPIDLRPKFHLYRPNIALLSGIAWDHINVFPTFENYVSQFEKFIDLIEDGGTLIYYEGDQQLVALAKGAPHGVNVIPYSIPEYMIEDGTTFVLLDGEKIPLKIFGDHNLQNLNGAQLVCESIGVSKLDFYHAISDFGGAANRLELISEMESSVFYKDFAHSPSKLKATSGALKKQYPDRKLVACMELHTFSSLNKDFLPQYNSCMKDADIAIVFFNPKVIEHKQLESISPEEVKKAFDQDDLIVFTSKEELLSLLLDIDWLDTNLLMMSSGNFDGIIYEDLANIMYS